ncbi:MAG: hypothetical protein ABI297_05915 [Ginsengibacter sp.]
MSAIALNKEMNIEVKVRLINRKDDEPITGNGYKVRLYDQDVFNDEFMGESIPDEEGLAKFLFSQGDFSKHVDFDHKPDFYFVVYRNQNEIFKSKVMSNLDLSNIEEFVMREGQVIDLGTFLISPTS